MNDALLSLDDAKEYAMILGASYAEERDSLLCVGVERGMQKAEFRFTPESLYRRYFRQEVSKMVRATDEEARKRG